MVARLGPGGPVLARVRVDAFWLRAAVDGFVHVVETRPDGSTLLEQRLIAYNLPPSVNVELSVLTSGAFLVGDTGELTMTRTITHEHLSAVGELTYQLETVADAKDSPCHRTDAFQGTRVVGRR